MRSSPTPLLQCCSSGGFGLLRLETPPRSGGRGIAPFLAVAGASAGATLKKGAGGIIKQPNKMGLTNFARTCIYAPSVLLTSFGGKAMTL